ncbi:DNA-binding domain-containing protein, AraC-type [Paraburkholderia piptadeniae]|uniref:DNA-binding domain-containing protein, AraC-type n=1 Tax=Paraburkholderia piptadeniae TaxID=1701573 RepID=A0A1N7SH72_9BURK|nr:helix-turn-helix transcriptional regulator [Paraburkholderia piptadeniae]SIT46676.1 DNA-binding domain-containing protein, AraC-type [Paraburkholderia piptadeniae]
MSDASTDPDSVARTAFVLGARHGALDQPWRTQRRAQFVHVAQGVLSVHTEGGLWVAPPHHAVWMLPGVLHGMSSAAPVVLRVLHVDAGAPFVPARCCVVAVDRLVDELLGAASAFDPHAPADDEELRLMAVIADRLPRLAHVPPLSLIYPRDPRARHIADTLAADPSRQGVLDVFAEAAAITARTAARLFTKETGLTFGQWRQQLRLLTALSRLGAGASVTQVALAVGYSDVSSFIAVFRDSLGETPARFFR